MRYDQKSRDTSSLLSFNPTCRPQTSVELQVVPLKQLIAGYDWQTLRGYVSGNDWSAQRGNRGNGGRRPLLLSQLMTMTPIRITLVRGSLPFSNRVYYTTGNLTFYSNSEIIVQNILFRITNRKSGYCNKLQEDLSGSERKKGLLDGGISDSTVTNHRNTRWTYLKKCIPHIGPPK